MKLLFSLFCLAACIALSSCSSVTMMRTKEIKNASESTALSINKRLDSLALVIDSLKLSHSRYSSRIAADLTELNLKINEQGDKSEARMEEISRRLELILAAVQRQSVVTKAKAAGSTEKVVSNSSELEALYNASRSDYLRGVYGVAYNGFKQIYETAQTGELAENALYWMGMCMLDAGKKEEAKTIFRGLLEKYPQSMKVCTVEFKLASMAEDAGNKAEQKAWLQKLLGAEQCTSSNEFQRAADILQNSLKP
ncbi:MAG: tetratricopeptide repeat protein [Fibromonadales bacterium]|nr:tetratricopeptide repeat protein [Fibromonadales bacterium]